MIRDDIKAAQIAAMKAGDKPRLATVRLMMARIKDRDIELRTSSAPADDDAMVVDLLQKMVKQRRESIAMFETGGRPEKAADEAAEIAVIETFLPAQMSEADTAAAIAAIKADLGASSDEGHGRGDGRAARAPRHDARHGPRERAGEGGAGRLITSCSPSSSCHFLTVALRLDPGAKPMKRITKFVGASCVSIAALLLTATPASAADVLFTISGDYSASSA